MDLPIARHRGGLPESRGTTPAFAFSTKGESHETNSGSRDRHRPGRSTGCARGDLRITNLRRLAPAAIAGFARLPRIHRPRVRGSLRAAGHVFRAAARVLQ